MPFPCMWEQSVCGEAREGRQRWRWWRVGIHASEKLCLEVLFKNISKATFKSMICDMEIDFIAFIYMEMKMTSLSIKMFIIIYQSKKRKFKNWKQPQWPSKKEMDQQTMEESWVIWQNIMQSLTITFNNF